MGLTGTQCSTKRVEESKQQRLSAEDEREFTRLWAPPGDGELLPIPGTGDLARGRRLDSGDQELVPGKGSV